MYGEIIKSIKVILLAPEKGFEPERVKEIRKILKMTQAEFGELFFQSAVAVEKWETGEREISGAAARVMQMIEWMAESKKKAKVAAIQKCIDRAKLRGIISRP